MDTRTELGPPRQIANRVQLRAQAKDQKMRTCDAVFEEFLPRRLPKGAPAPLVGLAIEMIKLLLLLLFCIILLSTDKNFPFRNI